MTSPASAVRAARSRTCGRLYSCYTLLERLAQDLKDLAVELGQFIQEEHAIVGQRHLAWHRHMAATDSPRIRDGVVRGTTRAGRHHRRAGAGAARDVMEARGRTGFSQRHGRHTVQPCRERA
jgi:hypothetical protein